MEDQECRLALGHGLPRCLTGLAKLQRPLYLNRAKRRRLLDREFVRARIGDPGPDSGKPGDYDRRRMFAFYGNPAHRRELWKIWLDGPSAERAPDSKTPPSLEINVLRKYFDEASSGTAEAAGGGNDKPPDRARLRETATELLQRLEDWPSLATAERERKTVELFCLATVLDDPGILHTAGSRVPELQDEYAEVLAPEPVNEQSHSEVPAPAGEQDQASTSGDDFVSRHSDEAASSEGITATEAAWRDGLQSLAAIATEATEKPPALDVLDELRQAVANLEEIEERGEQIQKAKTATEELKSFARTLVDRIETEPASEEVDPEELDRLRGAWLGIPALDPAKARTEAERLQGEVGQLVDNLRQSDTQHREVEHRLDTLRANRPSDRLALRGWRDERDDLREEATSRRRARRAAEDALIEALAPSFDGGEPEPAEGETTPPVVSGVDPPSDGGGGEPTDSTAPEEAMVAASPVAAEEPAVPDVTGGEDPHPADEQPAGAPSPEGDQAEAVPETDEPGLHVDAREAVARALAADPPRLAYATHVCRLLEELGIDAGLPRAALLEAALYASRFARPNSRLSAEYELVIEEAPSVETLTDREPDSSSPSWTRSWRRAHSGG